MTHQSDSDHEHELLESILELAEEDTEDFYGEE